MPFGTFVHLYPPPPPQKKKKKKHNNFFLIFIYFSFGGGGGRGVVAEGEHNVQMFKMALLFKEYKCAKLF